MFSIGDLVRVRSKICDQDSNMKAYYNKIGQIVDYEEYTAFPYTVKFDENDMNEEPFMWSELELVYAT